MHAVMRTATTPAEILQQVSAGQGHWPKALLTGSLAVTLDNRITLGYLLTKQGGFCTWLPPPVACGLMFQNKSRGSYLKFKNKEFLV